MRFWFRRRLVMESVTKNRKHQADIRRMAEQAFPGLEVTMIAELKEGYFNAVYDVVLSDGRQVILKIAPHSDTLIMSYEKNIMYSEVNAMNLVRKRTEAPVAEIYAYDADCIICDAPYFFMEKISGCSLSTVGGELPENEKSCIMQQVGKYTKQINSITGAKFGYPGQPDL
ncbi:MAG: phosphotransferase [Eubacteriales bacterium]|nr:phosphotransferase [Eubacteriales bacterium]